MEYLIGLIITLILFTAIYTWAKWQIKDWFEGQIPKEPEKVPVAFFGGPIDGHKDTVPEGQDKPHFFVPKAPDDESETRYVEIAGMTMLEPVYAKYQAVGTEGDYLYVTDVTREEMVEQVMNDG